MPLGRFVLERDVQGSEHTSASVCDCINQELNRGSSDTEVTTTLRKDCEDNMWIIRQGHEISKAQNERNETGVLVKIV